MKKKLTLLFSGVLLFWSCQKTEITENSGWNALSFTESLSTNYAHYMNEPHINISFPSNTDKRNINYEKGIWKDNDNTYVFTAHNWTDNEIVLYIYKDNTLFNEFILKPVSDNNPNSSVSLKDFSMSFIPSPGEYSFRISVKDTRGFTELNQYALHGSSNKMVVH